MKKCILYIILLSVLLSWKINAQSKQDYNNQTWPTDSGVDNFERSKNFMIFWYSNRKIENKKYQSKFDKIRPVVLKRLEKTILIKTGIFNISGIAEWRNDTIYYTDIVINNSRYSSTFAHELGHDAFPVKYKISGYYYNYLEKYMIDMINDAVNHSKEIGLSKDDELFEYYYRPEEIYSRICGFRIACKLRPDRKLSIESLNSILYKIYTKEIDDDNAMDLVLIINNHEYLLSLLNNLP